MKILVVEDDSETAQYIARGLAQQGHEATVAMDGREALRIGLAEPWDIFIVDRMLPGLDGVTLVQSLRRGGCGAGILFLTTLSGVDDRVRGLDAGADDYLVKPFALQELLARIGALGRRATRSLGATSLRFENLEMDLLARTVSRGGEPIDLLPREFRLLEYLMRHAEQVVTRSMLLEHVWDVHFDPHTSVVETHISRLRGKIDRGSESALIHTVRGAGYTLRAPK